MQKSASIACVVAFLGIIATQAAAQEFISQYTSADTRKCRKVERVKVGDTEYAAAWACKALAGYLVVVSEEDLRTTVSVGKSVTAAAREPAASQGFGPFNFTYDTVEWRSLKGAALPFALIQRWNISDGENPGKDGRPGRNALLIVTRLPPGPVCHIAYVDVKANREPNALARTAADDTARNFDCAKDKVRIVGERGRAIELAGQK
ncbi:MAG: hypothetical protein ACJ8FM_02460 [Xanthobacteraceae bacterium]